MASWSEHSTSCVQDAHDIAGTHLSAAAQRFFSGRYFCSCSARNCAFSAAFASRNCKCRRRTSVICQRPTQSSRQNVHPHIAWTAVLVCSTAWGMLRKWRQHAVWWVVCGTCTRRCSRVAFSAAARSSLAASSRLPASASTCRKDAVYYLKQG